MVGCEVKVQLSHFTNKKTKAQKGKLFVHSLAVIQKAEKHASSFKTSYF